jgi:hypothetical protein
VVASLVEAASLGLSPGCEQEAAKTKQTPIIKEKSFLISSPRF